MREKVFSKKEMKFLLGIGSALALRQLGLIMVMPFLAVYGKELAYSTPALIGFALGVYGLAQSILQIPFGSLSDRFGRKPIMLFGLLIFISGLILGYFSNTIYTFILARILQGSGAIMAVAYAWVGDNIHQDQRTKGMGIVGMLVGMSAVLAFLGGPILYRWFTVPEMFLLCALLAFFAWLFILIGIEKDQKTHPGIETDIETQKVNYLTALQDKALIKLIGAGFITNYLLVSQFFIVPLLLEDTLGVNELWKVFAPATLLALGIMRISAKYADRGYFRQVATLAFLFISIGSTGYFTSNLYLISLGLFLFMMGYMSLVTLLPAQVTQLSKKSYRGTITGVFNTFQFIGSFIGGSLTGILWGINPLYSIGILGVFALLGSMIIFIESR